MTIIRENRRDAPVYMGSVRDITVSFRSAAGALGDPGVVTFEVHHPSGVVDTLVYGIDGVVVRDSPGVFHVRQTFSETGVWVFGITGVGGITDAKRYSIEVQPFTR